jgi:hypothetical protein
VGCLSLRHKAQGVACLPCTGSCSTGKGTAEYVKRILVTAKSACEDERESRDPADRIEVLDDDSESRRCGQSVHLWGGLHFKVCIGMTSSCCSCHFCTTKIGGGDGEWEIVFALDSKMNSTVPRVEQSPDEGESKAAVNAVQSRCHGYLICGSFLLRSNETTRSIMPFWFGAMG